MSSRLRVCKLLPSSFLLLLFILLSLPPSRAFRPRSPRSLCQPRSIDRRASYPRPATCSFPRKRGNRRRLDRMLLLSAEPDPPESPVASTLKALPLVTKAGMLLGLVCLVVAISSYNIDEIATPTQTRASLLGVFSSVYLLTTYGEPQINAWGRDAHRVLFFFLDSGLSGGMRGELCCIALACFVCRLVTPLFNVGVGSCSMFLLTELALALCVCCSPRDTRNSQQG